MPNPIKVLRLDPIRRVLKISRPQPNSSPAKKNDQKIGVFFLTALSQNGSTKHFGLDGIEVTIGGAAVAFKGA